MRWFTSLLFLVPALAMAGGETEKQLCLAAERDGELAVVVEALMDADRFPYSSAEAVLKIDCQGQPLLERMVLAQQAENLEYAVIDMGADVNAPVFEVEAGKLSVAQFLMQQAVLAPSEEARAFAMDYMNELRDAEFNPMLSVTMY